jgi:hypothetical protein
MRIRGRLGISLLIIMTPFSEITREKKPFQLLGFISYVRGTRGGGGGGRKRVHSLTLFTFIQIHIVPFSSNESPKPKTRTSYPFSSELGS